MNDLRKEFEKNIMVKRFMDVIDVCYSSHGGYRYRHDNSPCYYMNGMMDMFLELNKPVANITKQEPCVHFSTTMFNNGKAECFGCGAIVSSDRKIITEAHMKESFKLNNLG